MKNINKNIIALYIASLFSYQFMMAPGLLGSMYADFPELSQNVVVLLFSAPAFISAAVSLIISPLMNRLNKKLMLISGMCTIILAGGLIVFTGGQSFPISLAGSIFTGIGYALILSTTNTLLVENSAPGEGSKAVGINMAVGCLGAMVLTSVSGVLAANGHWSDAYYLCFPVVVSLVLFILLYRDDKQAIAAVEPESDAAVEVTSTSGSAKKNVGLFILVQIVFLFMMLTATAWTSNFSSYVLDNGIGTAANSGMIATMGSLGGVLGGFLFTGFAVKKLGKLTVPVCLLFVAAPCVAGALGVRSIAVIYICAIIFMLFFQPVYSVIAESSGRLFPGPGVSIVSSVQGFSQFVGPYFATFAGSLLGNTQRERFIVGIITAIIGAIIALPVMRRAQS